MLALSDLTTDMTSLFWRNIMDFQKPDSASQSCTTSIATSSALINSSHSIAHDSTLTHTTKDGINHQYLSNSILLETIKIIDTASSIRCNGRPIENQKESLEASINTCIDCTGKDSSVTSNPIAMASKKDHLSRGIRSTIDIAGLKKTLSYHCNKFNGYRYNVYN